MNKLVIPVIALAVALTSCTKGSDSSIAGSSASGGDLKVSTVFTPNPPRQGPEAITVTVRDADGNAVRGATITITANMPDMSMKGPKLTAQDNGDGTYSARANLNYATTWMFDVKATSADGKTGSGLTKVVVK
jgi:YtkA-like protein